MDPKSVVAKQKTYRLYRKMTIFLYNLYIFVLLQPGCISQTDFALDASNSVFTRLWCTFNMLNAKFADSQEVFVFFHF